MIGDVWEWTASNYNPYPGYRPAEGEATVCGLYLETDDATGLRPDVEVRPLPELGLPGGHQDKRWQKLALFRRELDIHQTFFAMGEAMAHLHYLLAEGRVSREAAAGEQGLELGPPAGEHALAARRAPLSRGRSPWTRRATR